jgi:D-methionine transport system ATP-binding protein
VIRLEHVSKTFVSRHNVVRAVDDVSLDIAQGEIFGVIGLSGAGKSTLVRCINLLERPTAGRVLVDGRDMTRLTETELRESRRKIGMIFQHFNLFRSRTVRENIEYPLLHTGLDKTARRARIEQLLDLVGLTDKDREYPSKLSGGQKQRVGIARALASNPSVLLCDEATSALDPQTTQSILALLRELNRKLNLTIVIITHEMHVIKSICGQAAVMDTGRVVEYGSVLDIFSHPRRRITKDFIATTSQLNKIYGLLEENSPVAALGAGDILAHFSYAGRNTAEALISQVSIRYAVSVNIIFGDLDIIQHMPVGGLIVIVSGEAAAVAAALDWIREKGVSVEVIKRG